MQCYYQNVNGLLTKTQDLYNAVSTFDYDLICLTESGLTSNISSDELFPVSYSVFRSDRKFEITGHQRGGGALLAVRSDYKVTKLNLEPVSVVPDIDVVGCKVTIPNSTLLVFVIYIPPQTTIRDYELFFDTFERLPLFENNYKLLICGDFNIPSFNSDPNDNKAKLINNFLQYLDLRQFNSITNVNERLLDLILANFECNVSRDSVPLLSEDRHHPSLIVRLQLESKYGNNFSTKQDNKMFNFKRANFILLYDRLLQVDWSCLEAYTDPNDACDKFYAVLHLIFDECVPKFKKTNRRFPPWFNYEIKNNIRKKEVALKNYKKYKNDHYLRQFQTLRRTIKRQVDTAYRQYASNIENEISRDPSKFWSFVQCKRNKSRIPGTLVYNDEIFDTPQNIVNGFANFFSSIYTQSNHLLMNNLISYHCNSINIIRITEDDILKAIKKLKNKMTSGLDNVPSFLVRDCAMVFVKPLHILFNLVLATSRFPDLWKATKICPILKSGDPSFLNNYRSIAILSNFAKVFEIILYEYIYKEAKSLISPTQHGFMSKKSTVTNLAVITQFICDTLDDGGQVDVIYTDIQKAFDTIDHNLLLNKLQTTGFSDNLIELFTSYLSLRNQYVYHGGHVSQRYIATSGVPQGSNLGPLLFLIFINDLPSEVKCDHLLFADDLKIYLRITSIEDCIILQNELDRVVAWCTNNSLKLNVSKCKYLTFTRKLQFVRFNYNVNGNIIERCTEFKDLGVIFDSQLSFSQHINYATQSASKLLGFFSRNWSCFSRIEIIKTLFYSFIRSKLEYAALIWFPIYSNSIRSIESIQRKCMKFLFFKCYGFYPPRGIDNKILTDSFDMISLYARRKVIAVSFLYNLVNNNIDCPVLLNKVNFLVPRPTSRQAHTFYCPFARTNVMYKSPVFNMCRIFNTISDQCDINFNTLDYIIDIYHRNMAE